MVVVVLAIMLVEATKMILHMMPSVPLVPWLAMPRSPPAHKNKLN